jgi:hypothetical protein
LSIFLGAMHQHNDTKLNNDCNVCLLQSNLTDTNTPPLNSYLVALVNDIVLENIPLSYNYKSKNISNQRAPPYNS